MIKIYRRVSSDSAKLLAKALEAIRVRRADQIGPRDIVICWGEALEGSRVLNGAPLRSKLRDAQILAEASVPTIQVSLTHREGWLGRSTHHIGGNDLLRPIANPAFWVKRENIEEEFRVHSFLGRSIRAGRKIPRDGMDPHEWIRSWDGGWRIAYLPGSVGPAHRDLAHRAVKALGLDFGAVDIGRKKGGDLIVLEVNRAPGIEGGTVERYADAIRGWIAQHGGDRG